MTRRVCLVAGCPAISDKPRCPTHTRAADKARGTRQQRGYDKHHDRRRREWQQLIDAGVLVRCWRVTCGKPITGTAWHLGHDDSDRSITRGPECVTCNLSAAGKARHGISPGD